MSDFKNLLAYTEKEIQKTEKELQREERLKVFRPIDLLPGLIESWEQDKNPISISPGIDKMFRSKYRGKVLLFVGYGGSKKSMMAINVSAKNHNVKSIYSCGEMDSNTFLERLIDITPKGEAFNGLAQYLENKVKYEKRKEEALNTLTNWFMSSYFDNMLISTESLMTVQDYEVLLQRDKPDILIVDGLSVMGGDERDDVRKDGHNSRDLKNLAKKYKCCIIVMVHCSKPEKGRNKHTIRDLTGYIRNGEKIIDNMDACISFSRVENATGYRNDKLYLRVWDKRGKGGVRDFIFDFDEVNLTLTETDEEPSKYETANNEVVGDIKPNRAEEKTDTFW